MTGPRPARPEHAGAVVDLWWIDLDRDRAPADGSEAALDAHERDWARRLRDPALRRRYVARRLAVRDLLARYLACAPPDVAFDRRCEHCGDPAHGRPRLSGAPEVRHSVASAGASALAAVARGAEVGVDLETREPPAEEVEALAAEALTAGERARMDSAPPTPRGFIRAWARKEAFAKALGLGIVAAPAATDTAALPIVGIPAPATDAAGWCLYDVPVAAPAVAALAVRGPVARVGWATEPSGPGSTPGGVSSSIATR